MSYYTMAQAQTLISELIDEVEDASDPESEYMYNEVFNVSDMDRGEFVSYRRAGLDRPQQREILEDFASTNYKEGELQRIIPLNYGVQFAVPKEVIQDIADAGPWDGVTMAHLVDFAGFTKEMKSNCYWRVDSECAAKLLNGTSTAAAYVGRDGKALFSATQTGLDNPPTVQSNLTTGASFTANNVMTAISSLNTQRDDKGQFLRTPKKWTVVVSEQNRWKAAEIFGSEGEVGTGNNTTNPLYKHRNDIDLVVWNELGATYTGWFVIAKGHSLHWKWRLKPTFTKSEDFSANALKYAVAERGKAFHSDWRRTVGFPTS